MTPPPDRRADTPARLIRAARKLFAQRGYRGASIRAITAAARANLGAVTYHFQSKRALYEAVVEQCLRPVREGVAEVAGQSDPPMVRIEAVIRVFFNHLRRNPDVPQFLLQEVAAGDTPSLPVRNTLAQVLGTLAALVHEGQQDGSVRSADARLTAVSIVSQPIHLTLLGQLLGRLKSGRPDLPLDPDLMEQHAVEFVRSALQAEPEARVQ